MTPEQPTAPAPGSVGEPQPVAWRVKDFGDGWIYYRLRDQAERQSESTGARIEGLYPGPARLEQLTERSPVAVTGALQAAQPEGRSEEQ